MKKIPTGTDNDYLAYACDAFEVADDIAASLADAPAGSKLEHSLRQLNDNQRRHAGVLATLAIAQDVRRIADAIAHPPKAERNSPTPPGTQDYGWAIWREKVSGSLWLVSCVGGLVTNVLSLRTMDWHSGDEINADRGGYEVLWREVQHDEP